MSRIADIAAALPGYDPPPERRCQVQAFSARLVAPVGHRRESVPLFDALGRVLAEDIVSPVSVPPHDNSAMDGYAFDGAVLADRRARRRHAGARGGTALAGAAWRGALAAGDAVRIMTGAMMPAGLDTVIPQEFCKLDGDACAFRRRLLRRGDNRRLRGEDLAQGQPALRGRTAHAGRAGHGREPGPAGRARAAAAARGVLLHRRRNPERSAKRRAKARCTTATATPCSACSAAWAAR
jgi:molybdopterin molybdotransferase